MTDLVKMELTTTMVHAELVLKDAVAELKSHVAYLHRVQTDQITADSFGEARHTGARIDKALMGAFDAQHLPNEIDTPGRRRTWQRNLKISRSRRSGRTRPTSAMRTMPMILRWRA